MDERLMRVEEALGFAERTIEELSGETLRAHARIDELERALRALEGRLGLVEEGLADSGEDDDPTPDQD